MPRRPGTTRVSTKCRVQRESESKLHRTREAPEIPNHMKVWVNSGPEPVWGTVSLRNALGLSQWTRSTNILSHLL